MFGSILNAFGNGVSISFTGRDLATQVKHDKAQMAARRMLEIFASHGLHYDSVSTMINAINQGSHSAQRIIQTDTRLQDEIRIINSL